MSDFVKFKTPKGLAKLIDDTIKARDKARAEVRRRQGVEDTETKALDLTFNPIKNKISTIIRLLNSSVVVPQDKKKQDVVIDPREESALIDVAEKYNIVPSNMAAVDNLTDLLSAEPKTKKNESALVALDKISTSFADKSKQDVINAAVNLLGADIPTDLAAPILPSSPGITPEDLSTALENVSQPYVIPPTSVSVPQPSVIPPTGVSVPQPEPEPEEGPSVISEPEESSSSFTAEPPQPAQSLQSGEPLPPAIPFDELFNDLSTNEEYAAEVGVSEVFIRASGPRNIQRKYIRIVGKDPRNKPAEMLITAPNKNQKSAKIYISTGSGKPTTYSLTRMNLQVWNLLLRPYISEVYPNFSIKGTDGRAYGSDNTKAMLSIINANFILPDREKMKSIRKNILNKSPAQTGRDPVGMSIKIKDIPIARGGAIYGLPVDMSALKKLGKLIIADEYITDLSKNVQNAILGKLKNTASLTDQEIDFLRELSSTLMDVAENNKKSAAKKKKKSKSGKGKSGGRRPYVPHIDPPAKKPTPKVRVRVMTFEDLPGRLAEILGSIAAGNTSDELKQEGMQVLERLKTGGAIDVKQYLNGLGYLQ